MNTAELLNAMNNSSLRHILTNKEKELYLSCLNNAYSELYLSVAASNNFFYKIGYAIYDDVKQGYILPNDILLLKTVYSGKKLKKFHGLIEEDNFEQDNFIIIDNILYVHPTNKVTTKYLDIDGIEKKAIKLYYLPSIKKLVENITNPELETNTPIFNPITHYILVDYALRFLYDAQAIFFEKLATINQRIANSERIFNNLHN